MLEAKGGPDWKTIQFPPNRTQKACLHVWSKLKAEGKKSEWYKGGGAEDKPSSPIESGAGASVSGKKRGRPAAPKEESPEGSPQKKGKKMAVGSLEEQIKEEEGI